MRPRARRFFATAAATATGNGAIKSLAINFELSRVE